MKDKVYLVTVRVDLQTSPFLVLVKANTEEAAELKGLALLEYDNLVPLSAQAQEVDSEYKNVHS